MLILSLKLLPLNGGETKFNTKMYSTLLLDFYHFTY